MDEDLTLEDVREAISEIESEALSRYEDQLPEGEGVSWGEIINLDHDAYLDDHERKQLADLVAQRDVMEGVI